MLEELAEQVLSLGMVAGTVCYLEVMEDGGDLDPSYVPYSPRLSTN